MAVGVVGAGRVVGSMMALEAIKVVTGAGSRWPAGSSSTTPWRADAHVRIAGDPECAVCGGG